MRAARTARHLDPNPCFDWLTEEADERSKGIRLPAVMPMSSDAGAGDRDDPDGARQIILRATEAFDGRDHVMSIAPCKLHAWGTCDSAARNQPGFVPDEYVSSLTGEYPDSSGVDPSILAAELCTAGMWERVDGGYRVLDWREIQTCVDYAREPQDNDKRAPAGESHDTVDTASAG